MEYYNEEYLQHYGVKGMRWGVRRDVQTLANHRRNVRVKKIKNKYALGEITKEQKKSEIKKANNDKKRYLAKTKNDFEHLNNSAERRKMERDLSNQSVKEVPNRQVKNGMKLVNKLVTSTEIGANTTAAVVGSVINPALAPLYATALAGSTVGNLGRKWLIDRGLDKMS